MKSHMRMTRVDVALRALTRGTVLVGLLVLTGCGDDLFIPDFNNPSLEELQDAPTRTSVITAAQGLFLSARTQIGAPNGYVSLLGIIGRESYNFDGSDPRFITEMLINPLSPSSPAFGGNLWSLRYRSIRTAEVVLDAVDQVEGFTEAEREGIRGFARTIKALDLLLIINTRDANGAVIDTDQPLGADPAPIVGRDQVFAEIARLLDEAAGHLRNAGGSFAFGFPPGFEDFGFADPASFLQLNRALAARVAVYRGNFTEALTALGESFIDVGADLDLGAYHSYTTGSGDVSNGLAGSPDILAHPSLATDARLQPNGERDARFQRKVSFLEQPETQLGIQTDVGFLLYGDVNDPIPIIRNEELILLRAEANLGLGNLAAAAADINFIRTTSGGLAPLPAAQAATLDELLYNKRYSLLFEGGHSWIDARRYGRLDALPLAAANHNVHARFPIPEAECLARADAPAGVCP